MIKISHKGDFKRTDKFFNAITRGRYLQHILEKYAQQGVDALRSATPKDTGKTAESWGYEVESNSSGVAIYWTNTNVNDGVNIAVILQLGHGTGTGGYVQGQDYINPSMKPVFDKIAEDLWKEVKSL